MPRSLKAILPALLAWLLLLAPATPGMAGTRTTIKDITGRVVEVPLRPQRIVCLGPGTLRLIVYLKAQDRVVGIERMEKRFPRGRPYFMAHPELGRLPVVSPGGPTSINRKPDMEGVLRVRPQLIFATYLSPDKADQVQAMLGIPVVMLSYGRLGSFDRVIYQSLRLAGRILGKEKRAEEVVAFVEDSRRDLAQRAAVASKEKPTVYVGGIGFKGAHGIESSDADYLPFTWLAANNLARRLGQRGHLFLNKEALLRLDPEVIFLDGGGQKLVADDYLKKPRFYQSLRAFRKGRVYSLFAFNWYATNLGTALVDAYAIGKTLYPTRFADVDLPAKADQIYGFLVGRPVYAAMDRLYGPLGGRPRFLKR